MSMIRWEMCLSVILGAMKGPNEGPGRAHGVLKAQQRIKLMNIVADWNEEVRNH